MAIRFVELEPGAAKPGEAGRELEASALEPAPADEVSGREPAPAQAERPRPRGRGKAAATAREPTEVGDPAPADAGTPPAAGGAAKAEAAPLLFPDLPTPLGRAARARKNRHGFG